MILLRIAVSVSASLIVAGFAAPLAASDSPLTHPTNICMQDRVNAELGDVALDLVLAAIQLADQPKGFEEGMKAIGMSCLEQHGLPTENGEPSQKGQLVGSYVVTRAIGNEAKRRLTSADMDFAWLDVAIAEARSRQSDNLTQTTEALYAQMKLDRPQGLGIDVEATEANRLIGALAYAYTFAQIEMDRLDAELRR